MSLFGRSSLVTGGVVSTSAAPGSNLPPAPGREQILKSGASYQPSAFPQPSGSADWASANDYYARVHAHIMGELGPMSSETEQRQMAQMVAMSLPSTVPPGTTVGLSAPAFSGKGSRGEGGYASTPEELVKMLQAVEGAQWYQDIVTQRARVETQPSPAITLGGLQDDFMAAVNGAGESRYRDTDLNLRNPWKPKDGWFPVVSSSSVENKWIPAETQTQPGQIAHSIIVGNTQFDTADYLETVRARGVIESELQEMKLGKPQMGGDLAMWQETFGNKAATFSPGLMGYLFDEKGGARAIADIDISKVTEEDARETLTWLKTQKGETQELFRKAVALQTSWESLIQTESQFLEKQGKPLKANWDAIENKNVAAELLEKDSGRDVRREALVAVLGVQAHADVKSGQAVFFKQEEIEALRGLHSKLELKTPFEDLTAEQMGSLVQAAVYASLHAAVPKAENKAEAEATRDKLVTPASLAALGYQGDAGIKALQGVVDKMAPEDPLLGNLRGLASLSLQAPYMDRAFEVMAREGKVIEGYARGTVPQSTIEK